MSVSIEPVTATDTDAITAIYNHYIQHSIATFEEDVLSTRAVQARIDRVTQACLPWLVAKGPDLLGYAYARPWHERSAYRFTVETSLYVAPAAQGRGVGTQLYESLLAQLRTQGLRSAIGGISLPNPTSVALHEKLGFEKMGHFREVGFKFGKWIDVAYFQVTLNNQVALNNR